MAKSVGGYYADLKAAMDKTVVTGRAAKRVDFEAGIGRALAMILAQKKAGGKLYFIGNGASAAIASHQAVDFWKNAEVPSLCFNDPALLTCMGNDFGYAHVFEKPVEMFMEGRDILFAISSSGASENILRAAVAAKGKRAGIITLSGFKASNPLRHLGDLNFYVPASKYGHVEVVHHSICHCILDTLVLKQAGSPAAVNIGLLRP